MLSVRNIGKQYSGERKVDALKELSFDLDEGKFLSIVGRSGSGKSTLLAAIGGISRPSSGEVLVNGVNQWLLNDNAHADFRNRAIGYVFQFASLLPTLRAIDNVALPALVGGTLSDKEAYARAHLLLNQVGLGERFDFFPGQLSGGEQRRVAIARALINAPSLLLADEPTADLDEQTEEEILNLIIDIQRAYNLTLVVVTHNPAIAKRADRLLEMLDGQAINDVAQCVEKTPAEQARKLFDVDAEAAKLEHVSLGEGIERLLGKLFMFVIPMIVLFWGINYGVAFFEHKVLEAKEEERSAVEELAMRDLRADVKDVTFGPGKSYIVSIYLRNMTDDKAIYVMSPTVRGFIQIGSSWQEVPLKAVAASKTKVEKITGEQIYQYSMEPETAGYTQLLPYYMHIRLSNDILVSPSSQPKTDLIERSDNYYVYLKPHSADDSLILKKMKFPGKPPVWIPMPPH
ncbi:MAG: ABC transporter ATP-binding protein [Leptolyngbya sp.]|nr:ABC transporter ATP-binding protein [Candidatus Melainabacteria bacterium]